MILEPKIEAQTELPSQTQKVGLVLFSFCLSNVRNIPKSRHFCFAFGQNVEAPSPPEMNNCNAEPEVSASVTPQQAKPTTASATAVKKTPKSTKEQKKAKEEEKRLSEYDCPIHLLIV